MQNFQPIIERIGRILLGGFFLRDIKITLGTITIFLDVAFFVVSWKGLFLSSTDHIKIVLHILRCHLIHLTITIVGNDLELYLIRCSVQIGLIFCFSRMFDL